jgi:TonB family protein
MKIRGACLVLAFTGIASAQQDAWPARFQAGGLPPLPVLAVSGGEVILEVGVDADGRVASIAPITTTPPFTDAVTHAVSDWHFTPAEQLVPAERDGDPPVRKRVPSSVLVVAVFRPPSILTPTLGEPPKQVAPATDAVPFPLSLTTPRHHPLAFGSGVVLIEGQVGPTGGLADVNVLRSAPPFDEAAGDAVRQWSFRPALRNGVPVPAFVYIVLGFPVPVTVP